MIKIAPSVLSADFLHLEKDVDTVNKYADILHFDVMDGVFVPNISFGFPVIEAISKKAEKPMDVHLMIVQPERYIERFAQAGASMISFHLNATEDPAAVLAQIKALGVKAGLVINPDIPVESLFPYLKDADFILLMSVFAGFGGQKFIEDTYERIRTLRAEMVRQGHIIPIEVDGGINAETIKIASNSGANVFVLGTAFFNSDKKLTIEDLLDEE